MKRPIQIKSFQFDPSWIIYQDEDILVANKPSGLLSVPGRYHPECLLSLLQDTCPNCLIVHRLDMDTSGLMVFAKNKETHKALSIQFQERQTTKVYHALCAGKPATSSGQINLPMRCDWENRPLQMVDFKLGKFAATKWQKQKQFHDHWLVELCPITGRSHQLRLHMKMLGHPILGDNLYADDYSLRLSDRLCLHASSLELTHPTKLIKQVFTAPHPFEN